MEPLNWTISETLTYTYKAITGGSTVIKGFEGTDALNSLVGTSNITITSLGGQGSGGFNFLLGLLMVSGMIILFVQTSDLDVEGLLAILHSKLRRIWKRTL